MPNIQFRLGTSGPAAAAIVASAIACLDIAGEIWVKSDGADSLAALYDEAVTAVRS